MYLVNASGVVAAVLVLTIAPMALAERSVAPTSRLETGNPRSRDGHLVVAGNTAGQGGKLSIPQPRPTLQRAPAGAGEQASRAARDAWLQQQILRQHGSSGKRYGGRDAGQHDYCRRNPKSRHCGYRGESSGRYSDVCKRSPLNKACLVQSKK